MNGVKFTLRCAYSAAKASVRIDHRSAAAEAARRFCLQLLFRKGAAQIAEGFLCLLGASLRGSLALCTVEAVFRNVEIGFIKLNELALIAPDCQALSFVYETMDGNAALFTGGDSVDGKLGTGINIASDENIRLGSLICKGICNCAVTAAKLDGVSGIRMFRYVTLPSVRPAVVVVLTTIAIATLKVFDIVYAMTGGQFDTSIIANEFYVQSFSRNDAGIGAALAVLLFILVVPILIYNVRQMRLSEEQR